MTNLTIKGRENGPLLIFGSASYTDSEGNQQTTGGSTIALCRCGASANKPFCDGTHRKINFEAPAIELSVTPADN
jgi:CDGSH-type Zn-finger protein